VPELLEYKCPACGGAINFDSSIQKMKCPYCETEFEMETLKALDECLNDDFTDEMVWETQGGTEWNEDETAHINSYICKSCAGEIVADENTAATSCPFCDNPVVMTGKLSGALRPDYVIPFKLDKKAAKEGLMKHLKGKILLPKIFKDENRIEEIKGIYVPFWLFNADADANIRYRATKVRYWSDSNYNYTETRHYLIMRSGSIGYERVPVDGSKKIPDDLLESIEPYNFDDAVDFQTAYLAGYLADKYDVKAVDCVDRANRRIRHSTEKIFASTVRGYTTVTPEKTSIRLRNSITKYALYPVWILNTVWNNKRYTFAMNGQTGKFVGDLPLDKAAYWKWFAGLTAVFSIITFLITLLIYRF